MILEGLTYDDLQTGGLLDPLWVGSPPVHRKKIFIKPNLVSPPTRWDEQSCTHVKVIQALLIKILNIPVGMITKLM